MHDHGIPTAKVYGWIDTPMAYDDPRWTQRLRAGTDAEHDVIDDYLHILRPTRRQAIRRGRLARRSPRNPGRSACRYERAFPVGEDAPRPFHRVHWGGSDAILRSRGRESATVDSGQFHHEGGRCRGAHVEIGHIGDPMMDLAVAHARHRDRLRRLQAALRRYSEITGEPVDLDAIQRHHFAFTLTNQLPLGAALRLIRPPSRIS